MAGSYEVETLTDGPEVLDRLSHAPPPDAIVLDWMMPDVSGIDVLRFLRGSERPELRTLKILLLTAHGSPEQVAEGLDAGADDYLAKPYSPVELRARVGALIRSMLLARRANRAERAIRDLLAQAPDATLAVAPNGEVTWANAEAERLLGAAPIGCPLAELVPNVHLEQIQRAGPTADLHVRDRIYAPSVREVSGEAISGTVITLRDVTEARHAANRRLDFYSMIAHDLRSPISNMMLRSQLLAQGVFGDVDQRIALELQRIEDSGRQLVALIDDFLEIARFESMAHNLRRDEVDLCALARSVCDEYRPSIREQGLDLHVTCPSRTVATLGDQRRLRQVLTNLLTNAIKFTEPGGRIGVVVVADETSAVLEVSDTGRGIPPEIRDNLFTRFVREEGERAGAPGSGLGLMIVREIVGVHGGTVEVESQLDRGTRFVVRLPPA